MTDLFNPAIAYDSYKSTHWLQFAPDARKLFYYLGPRKPKKKVLVFGPQASIKEYFMSPPTIDQVEEAKAFWDAHIRPGIFNYEGWMEIAKKGYYPVEIQAVPEGTLIPGNAVMMTVYNTEEGFEWLPGVMETILLQVWYPTTVATKSYEMKQIIKKWMEKTCDSLEGLEFKLHDFGFRGTSSFQSAAIGGMSHLVNFMGTDTTAAIPAVWKYYDPNKKRPMVGFSIPAMEHSTVTSWGKAGEKDAYREMITRFAKPGTLIAAVSDSYDLDNAIQNIWCKELKQQVLDSGAILVVRPDSGDPAEVVVRCLKMLANGYGYQENHRGYAVLNNVRVIQGDGISEPKVIDDVLKAVADASFSADNVAFGMGGGLLQKVDRDTYGFAMKASAKKVFHTQTGEWVPIYKEPKDAPWKASRKGVVTTLVDGSVVNKADPSDTVNGELLRPIYRNGELLVEDDFETIRKRAAV